MHSSGAYPTYGVSDFYIGLALALIFGVISYYFVARKAVIAATPKAYASAFVHCMFPFAFYGVASVPKLQYLTVGFLVLLPFWVIALYNCIGNEIAGNPPKWMLPPSDDGK